MTTETIFGLAWTGFSLIFVFAGLYVANKGRHMRRRGKLVEETETTEVREIRPGKVEVKGTARQTDGETPIRSPISREDVLEYTVKVEEYESNSDGGGSWNSVYEDSDAVPFAVDDGTGEVRVDPPSSSSDRSFNFELERQRVGGGEEPSEEIHAVVEREKEVDDASSVSLEPLNFGERRRYSEGVIEPGEKVYVLGRAREEDAGWGERGYVVDEPTASDEFILSDKSEEQLVKEGKWVGLFLMVFGVVFASFGAFFALPGLGMIL